MSVFGALLVNIIITLVFFAIKPKEYKWYEVALSLTLTLALIFGAKLIVDKTAVTFTEYWGETIVSVGEQEPYNYWHSEQCSRQVSTGTDSNGNTTYRTEYYDCSEQRDVGPSWWCNTNLNHRFYLTEDYHDELVRLYGTPNKISNKRKNYATRDRCVSSSGTKFQGKAVGQYSYINSVAWSKDEEARRGVYTKNRYENRIKATDLSLFNISLIDDDYADTLGLFKYPKHIDKYKCPVFLGADVSEYTHNQFRRLNAKYGPTNQFRLWVLVYKNKPQSIAHQQENYWVKGNKNEMVICIGVNDTNEIEWSHTFSWAKSNILTAEVKSKVLDMYEYDVKTKNGQSTPMVLPLTKQLKRTMSDMVNVDTTLLPKVLPLKSMGIMKGDVTEITKSDKPMFNDRTLNGLYDYLDANLSRFERREFSEFSYLKVEPKRKHIIIIYILAFVISIGMNLYFSNNDIRE